MIWSVPFVWFVWFREQDYEPNHHVLGPRSRQARDSLLNGIILDLRPLLEFVTSYNIVSNILIINVRHSLSGPNDIPSMHQRAWDYR